LLYVIGYSTLEGEDYCSKTYDFERFGIYRVIFSAVFGTGEPILGNLIKVVWESTDFEFL
jgi:hypothetical protein